MKIKRGASEVEATLKEMLMRALMMSIRDFQTKTIKREYEIVEGRMKEDQRKIKGMG
jgi:hypothetical protein